ncbi:MAG: GFA family protein [Kiloniellales bacterium]
MSESATLHQGGCLCGAVRFEAEGPARWVTHCHCRSCRRATGSAFATYTGYARDKVRFSGAKPGENHSSPGVTRRFCKACGSPLSYEGARWPDEIHLLVAAFEAPGDFKPQGHVFCAEQLAYVKLADGLPRWATTASEGPPLE